VVGNNERVREREREREREKKKKRGLWDERVSARNSSRNNIIMDAVSKPQPRLQEREREREKSNLSARNLNRTD
jgi:hypothetical protein